MPTSSSKPLVTAPLSLVPIEAHQPPCGYAMLGVCTSIPRVPSHLSPGLCTDHSLYPPPPALQPQPPPPDLKGYPVKWAHLALAAPSSWVPLACLLAYAFVHAYLPVTAAEPPRAAAALPTGLMEDAHPAAG